MKTRGKIATAAAVALSLALLPALPAAADQGAAIVGSQAYYVTSTDQLSAQDTQADGASAIAEIRASAGSTIYSVTESRGNGYWTASGCRVFVKTVLSTPPSRAC
ncbi:hypothetical protein GCM10025869_12170 [Homoserinibacter gongjuensis]|uniref:Uncharacterized protein n=1 Tax=Homoserinibacter gongjuensis TaxID=1162968 RepID=A0ABQ6JQY8_9MICO|nr:hypothetical protein GCM10025869_12170 [Homoserinibacter gongjuensis]